MSERRSAVCRKMDLNSVSLSCYCKLPWGPLSALLSNSRLISVLPNGFLRARMSKEVAGAKTVAYCIVTGGFCSLHTAECIVSCHSPTVLYHSSRHHCCIPTSPCHLPKVTNRTFNLILNLTIGRAVAWNNRQILREFVSPSQLIEALREIL